jgi:hypothetical protein
MKNETLIQAIPLWAVMILTILLIVASTDVGRRLGQSRKRSLDTGESAPVGAILPAMLALVAFMLALTFSMALNRFDTRMELLLEEVNDIGTTFLRAGMLPEPQRTETRQLLRDYVDVRVDVIRQPTPQTIEQFFAGSANLLEELWSHATAAMNADRYSQANALFVTSLNNVIDIHTERVIVGLNQIPTVIWVGLYGITMLSFFALGYQSGLSGQIPIGLSLASAITFSVVILLIQDLDRNQEGWLGLNHQPTIDLQQWMQKPLP